MTWMVDYHKSFGELMHHICHTYNLDNENTLWFYPNKNGVIVLPSQCPADLLLETGESMLIAQRRQMLQRPPLLARALENLGDGAAQGHGVTGANTASSSSCSTQPQQTEEAVAQVPVRGNRQRWGTPSRSPKRSPTRRRRTPSPLSTFLQKAKNEHKEMKIEAKGYEKYSYGRKMGAEEYEGDSGRRED